MGFDRVRERATPLSGGALSAALAGIGMGLATEAMANANIEDALLSASAEGMDRDDLRVLSLLVTWLGVHLPLVNADRLVALVRAHQSVRIRAFWAAIAQWHQRDRRLRRLLRLYRGPRIDLLAAGMDFQIARRGEDPRFEGSALRLPAGILRDRAADVLSPAELAHRHLAYRFRVMMGPSYRADMWAALEGEPRLSAAQVARAAYGSYATASAVRHAFFLLNPHGQTPPE